MRDISYDALIETAGLLELQHIAALETAERRREEYDRL